MGRIELEVLSPMGLLLHESGLDEVVLRRREPLHDLGSECAILRHHGPELIATCAHTLRYRRGKTVGRMRVSAGVAEVLDEHVTLLITAVE